MLVLVNTILVLLILLNLDKLNPKENPDLDLGFSNENKLGLSWVSTAG